MLGLYCDTNSTTCMQQKAVAASCSADKECTSYNCLPSKVCGLGPDKPRHLSVWVYLVIGVGIFGGKAGHRSTNSSFALHFTHYNLGMVATLYILFSIHGRQRDSDREKRLQYWREQVIIIFLYHT
jgi:hypothetical protein